jgi:hypothetical protein
MGDNGELVCGYSISPLYQDSQGIAPMSEYTKSLSLGHTNLKSGGYLVLGKSESLIREARPLFDDAHRRERVYRKS